MGLRKGLKNIFNSVAGNLPVIGPHAGIETELLLAGIKPVGSGFRPLSDYPYIPSPGDPFHEIWEKEGYFAEIRNVEALDEAVRLGKLKSYDDERTIDALPALKHTFRYYFRPDSENEVMELIASEKKRLEAQDGSGAAIEYELDPELILNGNSAVTSCGQIKADHPLSEDHPYHSTYLKAKKLEEAARQGKLKSYDMEFTGQPIPARTSIVRYYCQPGQERAMMDVVAFNNAPTTEEGHVQQVQDGKLLWERGDADNLGYRKRDQWLWSHIFKLPKPAVRAVYFVNRNVTKAAYQGKMLRKAEKVQKKADRRARRSKTPQPAV